MSTMHVYLVTEDDWIYHHVTAASEAEAILFAKGHTYSEEEVEWNAVQLRDTRPVIRALLIPINDRCTEEERQRLKEVALVVLDTAPETMGVKRSRSFACADWAVRTVAPLALEAAGKPELALVLRGLGEVVDEASALLARDKTREVQKAAAAGAAYAAYAADAAAAAAYAAAADDDDAAAYAAYAADAAADAAAAYAAARKKMWAKIMDSLVPLVKRLASMNKKGAGE